MKQAHRDNTLIHSFGSNIGSLFRVDEPVPVIHFHFSYKKRKDNFVFQIKNRIFANGKGHRDMQLGSLFRVDEPVPAIQSRIC